MTEKQLREQLDAVYASTSWKITAPLRFFFLMFKTKNGAFVTLKKTISRSVFYVASLPSVRKFVLVLLRKFPNTKKWLKKIILDTSRPAFSSATANFPVAREEQVMTPTARAILRELRAEIQKKT
jgi:hypothetical protein